VSIGEIWLGWLLSSAVIGCIVAVGWKWKQVNINTDSIIKINEILDSINENLGEIKEHIAETKGYFKGLKNGKKK
jgi:hypothetical protein